MKCSVDVIVSPHSTTFLDTPFRMAVRSPPNNESVVHLRKGECHIAQHQTEYILGLTERGGMDKSGSNHYSFGNWASPNQHVNNIWKFDTKYSDIQPLGAGLDTGAQRGATGTPAEILSQTGTTLNMQPALGKAKKITFSWESRPLINSENPLFLSYQMCLCTTQICSATSFRLDV